jgi:hypothetical protein
VSLVGKKRDELDEGFLTLKVVKYQFSFTSLDFRLFPGAQLDFPGRLTLG